MSEEPLCGKCGLPMHKDDARRYFGFYAAHMEDRCGTLLRAKIDDREQKNARLIDAIVRFHVKGDLSEGQAAKATGLYRIDLRERGRTMVRCDDGLDVRRVPDPACAEAADRIEALAAENAALRERIARAQSCFWPEDDGETCYSDASDIYQEVDAGKVVGISCGGVIWTRYFAWLEPAVDCFDSDDDFVVDADTMEEAARLVRAELDRRASLPPEMDP